MALYVIHCRTGKEVGVKQLLTDHFPGTEVLLPERVLKIRKQGRLRNIQSLMFPGYLFVCTETPDIYLDFLKEYRDFIRFLWDNGRITPLPEHECLLLEKLLTDGPDKVIGISRGILKDGRIRILEGPLKDLEGRIVRLNKRKQRARVELSFFNRTMLVDLGLELTAEEEY